MLQYINNHAEMIASLAAVLAVLIALWQLSSSRRSQREATAKEIYKEYVSLAFENPLYALPNTPNNILDDETVREFKQYEWFVSYMLLACEEILDLFPDSKEWRETVTHQVEHHAEYLSKFNYYPESYSRRLREIIASATINFPVTATK